MEAFTVYSWTIYHTNPYRCQDMKQYKLLILKTSCQFPGKAWLYYYIVFQKHAAATGLLDWLSMILYVHHFHTRASLPQTSLLSHVPSPASRVLASLPIFVNPGMMSPAIDPLVSAITVPAVKNTMERDARQLSLSGLRVNRES